jgi:hypothetical protein
MHVETITRRAAQAGHPHPLRGLQVAARQAGWLTANEIRALENYPPVDGGDVLQVTPVGGASTTPAPRRRRRREGARAALAEFKDADAEQRQIIERMRERARAAGIDVAELRR